MRPLKTKRAVPSYEVIGDFGTLYTSFYSDHQNLTEQVTNLEEKFHLYQDYYNETTSSFEQLLESQEITSDISINTARTLGVRHKWEILNFFSDDDVNGNPDIFTYVDDHGDFKTFSPEEIEQIEKWETTESYPIKGIEGHHLELISDNKTNIPLAAEPDNILFATPKAHLHVLHEGSFFNQTNEQYINAGLTKKEMLESTLDYNYKHLTGNVSAHYEANHLNNTQTGLISGAVLGTITGLLHFLDVQRLQRKGIVVPLEEINRGRVSVAISSLKPVTVMMMKSSATAIYTPNSPTVYEVLPYEEAATLSSMTDTTELLSEALEVISIPSTIIGISSMNLLHKAIKQRMKKERSYLLDYYYKEQIKLYTYETLAFTSIGISFTLLSKTDIFESFQESLIEEGIEGVVTDFLAPTPGIFTVMAAYKLGKFGKKRLDNKKEKEASIKCKTIHFNKLYEDAILTTKKVS